MPLTTQPKTRLARLRVWILGALLFVCCFLFATGCAGRLSGTYTGENGVSMEFKHGKAYMATLGFTSEVDYEVKDKDLVLDLPTGKQVLHIQDDGSLSGFDTFHKVK